MMSVSVSTPVRNPSQVDGRYTSFKRTSRRAKEDNEVNNLYLLWL